MPVYQRLDGFWGIIFDREACPASGNDEVDRVTSIAPLANRLLNSWDVIWHYSGLADGPLGGVVLFECF